MKNEISNFVADLIRETMSVVILGLVPVAMERARELLQEIKEENERLKNEKLEKKKLEKKN